MEKGLSTLSLLIMVVLLGLVTIIAIPFISRLKISMNEGATAATLRTISTSQEQFRNQQQVDQDEDGEGEFGLLGELMGETKLRAANVQSKDKLTITFIKPMEQQQVTSIFADSGYYYKSYLPGPKNKGPITDTANGQNGLPLPKDQEIIDAQEKHYRVYAWPIDPNNSGRHCVAIDQAGEIMIGLNHKPRYQGFKHIPPFDAAVDNSSQDEYYNFKGLFKAGVEGRDGQIWTST